MTSSLLPPTTPADAVMDRLAALRTDDLPTDDGRVMAYVYAAGVPGQLIVTGGSGEAPLT